MANQNLSNAKTAKNDEFYTQLTDIERELQHYWQHFRGKMADNCQMLCKECNRRKRSKINIIKISQ